MNMTPDRDWSNSDKSTRAGKRVSGVFVVLGLLLMGLGIWAGVQRRQFLSHAAHTQGTVVALAEHSGSHGNPVYNPIFAFKDAAGHEWREKSSSGGSPPEYQVGQTVDVYYSPSHPATAELSGFFALWAGSVFATGIGLFVFLIGVFLIRLPHFHASRARL